MSERDLIASGRAEARLRLAAQSLKSCPLCGAINSAENAECFVCRWAGIFDYDPSVVQVGLDNLIDNCPELVETFFEKRRLGFFQRLEKWTRRLFHRRGSFDLTI